MKGGEKMALAVLPIVIDWEEKIGGQLFAESLIWHTVSLERASFSVIPNVFCAYCGSSYTFVNGIHGNITDNVFGIAYPSTSSGDSLRSRTNYDQTYDVSYYQYFAVPENARNSNIPHFDTLELFLQEVGAYSEKYPITYSATNGTVTGPSEAPVGDIVVAIGTPNANYGITDYTTQIAVTCNDIPVPFTFNATTNEITFEMPDPTSG